MSETVKLIIEIPKPIYDRIKYLEPNADTMLDKLMRAVQNSTPLDSNSGKAEVQAYFAGQTYGWDEGRKALIDDLKAEISNATTLHFGMVGYVEAEKAIEILDNAGKGDK